MSIFKQVSKLIYCLRLLLSLHFLGERTIRNFLIPTDKIEFEWADSILNLYKQFCPDFNIVVLHLKMETDLCIPITLFIISISFLCYQINFDLLIP